MQVVAIFGPTGVGKTEVAVALARLLPEPAVAVSADALQVYRGLGTLTGAASAEQRSTLEHRLVGFVPVEREFSAGEYMPLAHAEIDAALAAGRRPIVVGGTGLYLRAALAELSFAPPPSPELRARLEAELAASGPGALHRTLSERAPALAAAIRPTDRSRVVRALERLELGAGSPPGEELWTGKTRHPTLLAGLVMARDELYRQIDARAERIAGAGAGAEVEAAVASGASRTARKALGFEELRHGDVEAMKRHTRNYAKRQLTWMRKLPGVRLIDVTGQGPEATAGEIAAALERPGGRALPRSVSA